MPIDMEQVYQIESSGNPKAYNESSQARGLGQITPIVLKEWNNFHPGLQFTAEELFNPDINREVSTWYMQKRIPQMLKAKGLPITDETMLWAYNAGIGRVVEGVKPVETRNYIQKYRNAQRFFRQNPLSK